MSNNISEALEDMLDGESRVKHVDGKYVVLVPQVMEPELLTKEHYTLEEAYKFIVAKKQYA